MKPSPDADGCGRGPVCESGGVEEPEQLRVSFPADQGFDRIGRVAVAGLALRLGFGVASVERLRLAVDSAVNFLSGPGRVTLVAAWTPSALVLDVSNPDVHLDDDQRSEAGRRLAEWVDQAEIDTSRFRLVVPPS